MRNELNKNTKPHPEIRYRGLNASRVDNLTDAVFGIAITLLIFNLVNPNSFNDLITFTKTLPAFLISISFLMLFWSEHLRFSRIYTLNNTAVFALYFILFLFYYKVLKMKEELHLNRYELIYTKWQRNKLIIMFLVPFLSVLLTVFMNRISVGMASAIGGFTYMLYVPAIIIWRKKFSRKSKEILTES